MVICSKLGIDFCCCAPSALFPKKELVDKCREFASVHSSKIILTEDVEEGLVNASAVYTQIADNLVCRGFDVEARWPSAMAQKCREKIST